MLVRALPKTSDFKEKTSENIKSTKPGFFSKFLPETSMNRGEIGVKAFLFDGAVLHSSLEPTVQGSNLVYCGLVAHKQKTIYINACSGIRRIFSWGSFATGTVSIQVIPGTCNGEGVCKVVGAL